MAMDFPSSPSLGQVFGNYTYDGEKWKQTTSAGDLFSVAGRLTFSSTVPIMVADVTSATSIYWTPYNGCQVPFYDSASSSWYTRSVTTQLSCTNNDTSKNPSVIGVSKVNDWFLWDDAGTIRLGHGPDWTNDTTRSAGTVLSSSSGIMVNNIAITNGPGASKGTYVGTTRSESNSSFSWSLGSSASGGGLAKLNVWNMYNRVTVIAVVSDSTANWTNNSAAVRTLNSSSSNRINFVSGLAEDPIQAEIHTRVTCPSSTNGGLGANIDSTTVFGPTSAYASGGTAAVDTQVGVNCTFTPQLGFHFLQALEKGHATALTFYGGIYQAFTGLFRI